MPDTTLDIYLNFIRLTEVEILPITPSRVQSHFLTPIYNMEVINFLTKSIKIGLSFDEVQRLHFFLECK